MVNRCDMVRTGSRIVKTSSRASRKAGDERRWACKDCDRTYTAISLDIVGYQPFTCPFKDCDRTFTRRDNMMQHYRAHIVKSSKSVSFGLIRDASTARTESSDEGESESDCSWVGDDDELDVAGAHSRSGSSSCSDTTMFSDGEREVIRAEPAKCVIATEKTKDDGAKGCRGSPTAGPKCTKMKLKVAVVDGTKIVTASRMVCHAVTQ
ncbi:hypothetical protein BJ742DRAFT_893939 [Cladochytrium replicatum]|nr:hypothetical protein BJ742DRAFT_893939 [Cladochytrium replicatum]